MVEVLLKKKVLEELIELEDFVILEELTTVEEDHEMVKVELEEKSLKKALLKLLKKAKYNAKYLEEMVDVNKVKRNILYRNYRLF
jgi:ribosomal protein L22